MGHSERAGSADVEGLQQGEPQQGSVMSTPEVETEVERKGLEVLQVGVIGEVVVAKTTNEIE